MYRSCLCLLVLEPAGSLPISETCSSVVAEQDAACRDLKSGNLLVADSGHILLADFGACAILEREAAAPGLATALHPNEDCSNHSSGSSSGAPGDCRHCTITMLPCQCSTPLSIRSQCYHGLMGTNEHTPSRMQ